MLSALIRPRSRLMTLPAQAVLLGLLFSSYSFTVRTFAGNPHASDFGEFPDRMSTYRKSIQIHPQGADIMKPSLKSAAHPWASWLRVSAVVGLVLALIFSAVGITPAPAAVAAPADGRSQSISAGQTPDGLTAAEWGSIRQAVAAAEYHFAYHNADAGSSTPYYWAPNRGQGWQTVFGAGGVQVRPPSSEDWSWGLTLTGYGYAGALQAAAAPTLRADQATLTYQHDANLSEWWINTPQGLEQGFTLLHRPAGSGQGALTIEMAVTGTLTPMQRGEAIHFQNAQGETLLTYAQLYVTDANGKVVPARLSLSPWERAGVRGYALRILVDDAERGLPPDH